MRIKITRHLGAALISVSICIFMPSEAGATGCTEPIGKLVSVQGVVEVRAKDEKQWASVELNDMLCNGDMMRVRERSRAAIFLKNETILRLDQNTTITFSAIKKKEASLIDLITGAVHFISRVPKTLNVNTPFVNGTVEGTEFVVEVFRDRTLFTVFEGNVSVLAGSLTVSDGQSAVIRPGQAPLLRTEVQPLNAVKWAFYYPAILYHEGSGLPGGLSDMEKMPEDISDPELLNYRASLLLAVGRVDEAVPDIERALSLDPGSISAAALQVIIAIVNNEREKALRLAKSIVENDPDSALARVALSYAQQADFDLINSLENIRKAVSLDPLNSLAWARFSELLLSFGRTDEGLSAAEKAEEMDPALSRAKTALGFAHLIEGDAGASIKIFEEAVMLDQADPLPRMGLGLAKIRKGGLEDGRKEVEIAAGLDPAHSLIRSYLGKAYYEEKREGLSAVQLDMAEEFDPLDPTPHFYEAILKQSMNRPVEALRELQRSIALNDNRAVYRSRLLLDEDLAARSAGLARLYSGLGFERRALAEGWRALSYDPGSYEAHRFLADSYFALPRHEVARVSELLQSQMLQPENTNPVQPRLAESGLYILQGAGPGDLSFNEFNPVFNRERFSLQTGGIAGENNVLGDEVVLSVFQERFSLSFGQFFYDTDGFRENNDLRHEVYSMFAQTRLSSRTSVIAELRSAGTEKGDLPLRFFSDDFLPDYREEDTTRSARLGIRHKLSESSDILATVVYKDSDEAMQDVLPFTLTLSLPFPPFTMDIDTFADLDIVKDDDGSMAEVQHQYRRPGYSLISGAGYFAGDRRTVRTTKVRAISSTTLDVTETDIKHTNAYLYSLIKYPRDMTWTVGGSVDLFEGSIVDRSDADLNPKLGLSWEMSPDTTLRAAVFRTWKRTLVSSQTLEPTQVAGFNQFYDDGEGAKSLRYGLGLDRKFSGSVFAGAEVSGRELEVPYNFVSSSTSSSVVQTADWREQAGGLYLYLAFAPGLSFSTEYRYERFDRDEESSAGVEQVEIHSVPVGINYSHPSGFGTRLKASYIDNKGSFQLQGGGPFMPGSDRFWIVDASVDYRIPKRYGFITVGANNLFNEDFRFQDMDPLNPAIQPERLVFVKFRLAL